MTMDEKTKVLRSILHGIYIRDEDLQDRVIELFLRFTDGVESAEVLGSKLAGFVYSYVKSNLCRRDELAWEIFLAMFSGLFHDHLRRRRDIMDELTREEIIQEFLHHIMKKCADGRFNPHRNGVSSFRSYVMTAFKNFTTNYLQRRISNFESIEELEFISDPGNSPDLTWCERILLIMESRGFSLEERLLIRLKCDGFRQKEIATIMGKSEAYISRKFKSVVQRLREILRGQAS